MSILRIGFFSLLAMWSVQALGASSPYLFLWAADADEQDSDFLAVLDADPHSVTYGDVLTTLEVGIAAGAHHSEHRLPGDAQLFVNGFNSGHSFVIDLRDPLSPVVRSRFTGIGEFRHPHSFERLPNGNVLATFQNGTGGKESTGGIVELAPTAQPVRSSSAAVAEFPDVRPYSLTVLPGLDRVVTTTNDMWGEVLEDTIQIWRLSDLLLLQTLSLPEGPRGDEQLSTAEPRLMADGKTLLVNTFMCGLYQIHDVGTDHASISHIYTFQMVNERAACALPALFGDYWIQTVPSRTGLVTLDLSDPTQPREVASLSLGEGVWPHWIAREPDGNRIIVTGYGKLYHAAMIVTVNPATGGLEIDRAFGADGIVDFGRQDWPHGSTGPAVPHGSVFSNP